jgi:hypothetical protein
MNKWIFPGISTLAAVIVSMITWPILKKVTLLPVGQGMSF